ncbi:Glycosyltransferase involved in cell wall bisynthesis [Bacillus sp. OV194]|nr:Glycosyltransferase involved in cell wall bisynthesis [Bacillus sp. OV194]
MNILVNATALDSRGSLSVIQSFLKEIKESEIYLKENNIFLTTFVARKDLVRSEYKSENNQIEYVDFPKKSIFHKIYFENIILKRIIKTKNISAYLSLQNIGLNNIKIPQFVLMHQALIHSNLRFNEIEMKNFIKYSLLMKYIIKCQIKKIDGIFVQTKWMESSIVNNFKYKKKIWVINPRKINIKNNNKKLPLDVNELFYNNTIKLVYPTNREKYKNNIRLIRAVNNYNSKYQQKVTLYLTIDGESTEYIKYIGKIPYESVYNIYSMSDALIFPSLTESLGLPIIEAAQSKIDLILADLPYAHEYKELENVIYFKPRNIKSIEKAIRVYTTGKYNIQSKNMIGNINGLSYLDYIKIIFNEINNIEGH